MRISAAARWSLALFQGWIHGTNEGIGVENYGRMIRFYHRLMENAAFLPG